jgi:hypothetical protein
MKRVRLTKLALVALAAAGTLSAQNARIGALGNNFVVDDVSRVIVFPGLMGNYGDVVQATSNTSSDSGATYGIELIGVKDLGALNLGGYYSGSRVLRETAYVTLSQRLGLASDELGVPEVEPVPHVLVGFDVGNFGLGFDLFWEQASSSFEADSIIAGVTTSTESDVHFRNPGLRVGLSAAEEFALSSYVEFSWPLLGVEEKRSSPDGTAIQELTYKGGPHLQFGAEGGFKLLQSDWKLGVEMGFMAYQTRFEDKPAGQAAATVTTSDKNRYFDAAFYLGFTKEVAQSGVMLSVVDNFGFSRYSIIPEEVTAADPKEITSFLANSLIGSLEKEWTGLRHLDAIAARVGARYSRFVVFESYEGGQGTTSIDTRFRDYAGRSFFGPTFGTGIRKGLFSLDLQIAPNDLLRPVLLSATFDFKGNAKAATAAK